MKLSSGSSILQVESEGDSGSQQPQPRCICRGATAAPRRTFCIYERIPEIRYAKPVCSFKVQNAGPAHGEDSHSIFFSSVSELAHQHQMFNSESICSLGQNLMTIPHMFRKSRKSKNFLSNIGAHLHAHAPKYTPSIRPQIHTHPLPLSKRHF